MRYQHHPIKLSGLSDKVIERHRKQSRRAFREQDDALTQNHIVLNDEGIVCSVVFTGELAEAGFAITVYDYLSASGPLPPVDARYFACYKTSSWHVFGTGIIAPVLAISNIDAPYHHELAAVAELMSLIAKHLQETTEEHLSATGSSPAGYIEDDGSSWHEGL